MKALKRQIRKTVRRVKRVLRISVKRRKPIEVPREDVWERPYPDEIGGWETKGRYRNSGESPKKGEKSLVVYRKLKKRPAKRKPIVFTLAYLQENLPVSVKDSIVRDPRIEPEW